MKLNVRRIHTTRGVLYLVVLTYILAIAFITFPLSLIVDVSGEKSGLYSLIGTSVWALWIGWYIIRHLRRVWALKARNQALIKKSSEYGMQPAQIPMSSAMLSVGVNASSHRGATIEHSYVGADWGYGEYQFKSYVQSKRGRKYDTATFYYAVAMFTLPRKLPNVFFDSHKTGGKEFSVLFDAAQKHSLESVFDDYFTAYFHEDYKIDSLSFITPEVMEALIAAQEYDVEIYQDKLYIYNELENMPRQLEDMWRSGDSIRQKLLNNILTYRDERIDFADGRITVSTLGLKLRRSIKPLYFTIAIGVVMLLATLIGSLFWLDRDAFFSVYVITGPFGALMVAGGIISLKQRKKERTKASARSHIAA